MWLNLINAGHTYTGMHEMFVFFFFLDDMLTNNYLILVANTNTITDNFTFFFFKKFVTSSFLCTPEVDDLFMI